LPALPSKARILEQHVPAPVDRLRIATVSYGLPVPGLKRGGIERVADTIAEGLARRGHEVIVFTHDPRPDRASYEVRKLPWKGFVDTWLGRRLTMGYLGNVLALVPDYSQFDVILAHGDSLLLPLAGKPLVRVMHGSALGEARSSRSVGRFILQMGVYGQELLTSLLQNGVVAVSDGTRRDNPFIRRTIPLGFDDSIFLPQPAQRTSEPSLLFVGSLGGRKRGEFLLRTFTNAIRTARPDASLTIVGDDGPPTPGVTYRVGVDDTELAILYRRAWLYVTPSTYEGFGLPYLEAMACGTPVVATPNPGSQEILDGGRYGALPTDAELAPTVLTLLDDPSGRAELAELGLERASHYTLSAMLDRYEALLYELSQGHARPVASL
jgi:glycosyltransferase involved in cell wall biosynthesis